MGSKQAQLGAPHPVSDLDYQVVDVERRARPEVHGVRCQELLPPSGGSSRPCRRGVTWATVMTRILPSNRIWR